MFAKRIIFGVSALAIIAVLAGCQASSQSTKNTNAMNEMVSDPHEGYKLASTTLPYCSLTYCNEDVTYQFSGPTDEDKATNCQKIIEWGKSHGGDSWLSDFAYVALPIEGHEGAAKFACFGRGDFNVLGTSNEVRWQLVGVPGQMFLSTRTSIEGGIDGEDKTTYHTWDEGRALLSEGDRLDMDILSALETYRAKHPKANPSSAATVKKALARIELPKGFKLIRDTGGGVHFIDLPSDGVFVERCINITPFDETYFKFPNPMTGFTPWSAIEGPPVDQFAFTTTGPCDAK